MGKIGLLQVGSIGCGFWLRDSRGLGFWGSRFGAAEHVDSDFAIGENHILCIRISQVMAGYGGRRGFRASVEQGFVESLTVRNFEKFAYHFFVVMIRNESGNRVNGNDANDGLKLRCLMGALRIFQGQWCMAILWPCSSLRARMI